MLADVSSGHPQDTEPTIEVTWPAADVALVALGGEQDMGSAQDVEDAIREGLLSCAHLVVDLSAVQFVDSSIINLLVQMRREADEQGCDFNLVLEGAPSIERTFEICGVLPELNRVTTLDAALRRGR